MSRFLSLFRVELDGRHAPTGATKHWLVDSQGTREFAPFVALEIAQYSGDGGYYLLYQTAAGTGTDTWHETLEDAKHQAEFEFNVRESDWVATTRLFK